MFYIFSNEVFRLVDQSARCQTADFVVDARAGLGAIDLQSRAFYFVGPIHILGLNHQDVLANLSEVPCHKTQQKTSAFAAVRAQTATCRLDGK